MILLDVNIVLAAHRADHPHHERLDPWFRDLTAGDDPFWVPDIVWSGFVRLSTNRRVFPVPTPVDLVFDFLRSVRSLPNHASLVPTDRHLEIFESLCRDADATGDLVPDAYLAALAVDHGCEIMSFDRDFARFPGLRWRIPGETNGKR